MSLEIFVHRAKFYQKSKLDDVEAKYDLIGMAKEIRDKRFN